MKEDRQRTNFFETTYSFWPNVTTAYGMSRTSVVCLSSVTLLHPRQRLGLFGNIFVPPNSSGTRTVYTKIVGKNSKNFCGTVKLNIRGIQP